MLREEKDDWRDVDEEHGYEGAEEQQRGIVELGECGAGDHVGDFAEGSVGAQANAGARQAHPEAAAAALYGAGEGAIVDDFIANGGKAADSLQRVATQKNAASSGACGARARVGNPTRRIQLQEKEKEGGDERARGVSWPGAGP